MATLRLENTTQNSSLFMALWGTALLFAGSQLNIPLQPVPITLQTVAVMLIGLIFERTHAIKAVLIYLGLGAIGVPVFANYQAGLQCLFGLTGGYLWGFLAAIVLMTTLKRYLDSNNILHVAFNCLCGTIVILTFGICWLAYSIGLKSAIECGLYPFIIPGIIKALLLASAVRYLKPNASNIHPL